METKVESSQESRQKRLRVFPQSLIFLILSHALKGAVDGFIFHIFQNKELFVADWANFFYVFHELTT